MRFAPFLMVGVTASAALAGGALLTAEDRALFEPHHAMAVLDVVDEVGAAWEPAPAPRASPVDLRRRDGSHADGRR